MKIHLTKGRLQSVWQVGCVRQMNKSKILRFKELEFKKDSLYTKRVH